MHKNQRISLRCERLGAELEGICTHEGKTVFVPGALPGEEVEALVVRVQPRYAFAKLLEVKTASEQRVSPPCPAYGRCGGCSGQHMTYQTTLEAKHQQVIDCLCRIGGFSRADLEVRPPLGAEQPFASRNKTSLPVGGTLGAPLLGFYRKRSHQLVPVRRCLVAMDGAEGVIVAVQEWMISARVSPYSEESGKGLLRHVVLRTSQNGSAMVVLVATQEKLPEAELLVKLLIKRVPGFCSLHVSVNKARTNVILGKSSQKIFGQDCITEELLGLSFEISPLSFFQVNPMQTQKLYRCAVDFAQVTAEDVVVDAYAGAGTIALCMAQQAGRVIGIEVVPQAVDSARRNAIRNQIENVEFHAAPVESLLPVLVEKGLRPDVMVLDPPRKGIDAKVVGAVVSAAPRRIVYISCHVPTQARDLALLRAGGYRLAASQPVDMFCYAGGIENVCLMVRE